MTFVFIIAAFLVGAGIAVLMVFLTRPRGQDEGREALKDLTNQISSLRDRLTDQFMTSSREMHAEIRSFTQGVTEMREALKQVHESVRDVSSFQELFKSPKLRGEWGEASLEHILSQHYPQELCELQYTFSNGERADAVFKLPDGRLLAIDAKFPSENFLKMAEATTETEKGFYKKKFIQDVQNRIDEVASKYILPQEGTLDFALMYVPAEAIYYEIVNQIGREVDLAGYGWKNRIILTSPNILYLTLRTIEHWFQDVQVSRETQEILKRLARIMKDAERLSQDFKVLGRHIANARTAYESSEKRLGFMVDRVGQLTSGKKSALPEPEKEEPTKLFEEGE